MKNIQFADEMYRQAVEKESFIDKLAKYFKENENFIRFGLAAMSEQDARFVYQALAR